MASILAVMVPSPHHSRDPCRIASRTGFAGRERVVRHGRAGPGGGGRSRAALLALFVQFAKLRAGRRDLDGGQRGDHGRGGGVDRRLGSIGGGIAVIGDTGHPGGGDQHGSGDGDGFAGVHGGPPLVTSLTSVVVNYNTSFQPVNTPCRQSWFKPRRDRNSRATATGSAAQ